MNDMLTFLNGKKTYIGILAWVAVSLLSDWGKLDPAQTDTWITIVYGMLGVGVTHKVQKLVK